MSSLPAGDPNPAEDHFKKLVLRNRLVSEEEWAEFQTSLNNHAGQTLPEALIASGRAAAAVVEKIRAAIEGRGFSFPPIAASDVLDGAGDTTIFPDTTSDSHLMEIPDPDRQLSLEPASGEETLGFADENLAPLEPVPSPEQDAAPQADDSFFKPASVPAAAPPEEAGEEGFSSRLFEESVCRPDGAGAKLEALLSQARTKGSSDLHISVGVPVFQRKFGEISRLNTPPVKPEEAEAMLFGVLNQGQKQRLLHEQQLDFCLHTSGGQRYRANIAKERTGWCGSFRIIPDKVPDFKDLGLPPSVKQLTEYNQGLVLVTGPRGCGKTTTLAAMIELINNSRKEHIITIEDPIEYRFAPKGCRVTQRSLGSHTLSYANAMRAALREDPDVILVGELRDIDTTSMAITASETGHLVLASMHTASADRTIDRLVDTFPPDQQAQIRAMVGESFRGVVCQQLLPRKDGKGQVAALEILLNNSSVRKMVIDGRSFQLDSVMQTSRKQGMLRLDDALQELLQKGVITEETARSYQRKARKKE